MVSIVLISNWLYGKLSCPIVNYNELNVYGKKIVNYVTLIMLRYPIEKISVTSTMQHAIQNV